MADLNSLTLDVASWIAPRDWRDAIHAVREGYLAGVARLIKDAKQRQVLKGIGADGEPLKERIRPRADGATGPALDPHRRDSRSYKWVRASVSRANGTVTVWWSHGWGRILGFHARGEVIGTYMRNVIGFPPGVLAWLKGAARRLFADLKAGRHPASFGPPPDAPRSFAPPTPPPIYPRAPGDDPGPKGGPGAALDGPFVRKPVKRRG